MPSKDFELSLAFAEYVWGNGPDDKDWLPVVPVTLLVPPTDHPMSISLLFDTGASQVILRRELYPALGLLGWDFGEEVEIETANGTAQAWRYEGVRLRLFGKTVECPVHLAALGDHPMYQGLLGREDVFEQFGFGFWEQTRELFITTNP